MSPPVAGATSRWIALTLLALLATGEAWAIEWRALQPGLEYAIVPLASQQTSATGRLHVVRIDPARVELRALMASEVDGGPRSAGRWCEDFGLSVAINLGMFQEDGLSNVGHARNGDHVNSRRWASTYKSAFAFGAKRDGLPPAVLVDLDREGARAELVDYASVIQNLRLIKSPGVNVWSKQDRRWSEAALAVDRSGRVLFLFAREPFAMWDLNQTLLALPLSIERAMHLEGGRQASLSIRAADLHLDLSGSFDTGFAENEGVQAQRGIPNAIGVVAAPAQD